MSLKSEIRNPKSETNPNYQNPKLKILSVFLSAILLILSFPSFNLEFLAWFAFVPLFFALKDSSPKKAFFLSYLTGVIFFLGTIYWLIHVTLPGMIVVVLYLALYFGIFGLFFPYAVRCTQYAVLFIPAAWVTTEWLRANLLTGFGWVLLGHSQSYNLPFIQIADIFGAYGVSFLVILANAAIFLALRNIKRKVYDITPVMVAVILVFATLRYGYIRMNNAFTGEKLRVAVVQGNIPQDQKWDENYRGYILEKYVLLTKEAAKTGADLIVWPETSVPGVLESERDLTNRIRAVASESKVPMLVGTIREDRKNRDLYYNSATLITEDGRIAKSYDKIHLVPFGEYIPFKKSLSFVQKFARMPIGDVARGGEYTVFMLPVARSGRGKDSVWTEIKKARFSALICFEDLFPDMSREFVKNGASFLVNITNDAWYKISSAPYQHAQSSVFRAVENRVNVIRAANTGLSCFIDQKGRITDTVNTSGRDIFVDGFKVSEITVNNARTLYNIYGDAFAYICMLLTLAVLLKARYGKDLFR